MEGRLKVFSGNAHPALAAHIARQIDIAVGEAIVGRWRNGETRVRIEENVRGSDVFLIQPLNSPADHHIMELLLMIDAVKRASAGRITAVIPYYAYARQEKKMSGREPISAKLLANLISVAGANRILAMDLHAPAIEGFFDIPVDHLRATHLFADYFRELALDKYVVVAPDAGRVGRALELKQRLGGDGTLAFISKMHPSADVSVAMDMVGDVVGRTAIIADDMILTGGTLIAAAEMLKARGAHAVYASATHAALADGAAAALEAAPFERLVVTDTVPVPVPVVTNTLALQMRAKGKAGVKASYTESLSVSISERPGKFHILTVAPLLADAIVHIHKDLSVSTLFR